MKKLILTIIFLSISINFAKADITTGLVGWWKLDEGTGTSTADSSGNTNTGTLQGGATWFTPGQVGISSVSLSASSAQYVEVPNSTSLSIGTGAVTMCAWVYNFSATLGGGNYRSVMAKRNDTLGTPYAYGINYGPAAPGNFQVYTSGTSGIAQFTYSPPVSNWEHMCAIMSSSPSQLYINGILFATASGNSGGIATNTASFHIGSSDPPSAPIEFFDGREDDVRVYNRALTAADVYQVYQYSGYAVGSIKINNAKINNAKLGI